jgi:hypothetical protein
MDSTENNYMKTHAIGTTYVAQNGNTDSALYQ